MVDRFGSASVALALLTAGCVGSFSTPSAYQQQEYLCDAQHASDFQALADSCAGGMRCAGVFSLTGSMQNTPLTFGGTLASAQYFVVQMPGATTQQWDQAKMSGASPYFDFIFHVVSIGGTVGQGEMMTRTLSINSAATTAANSLADDQVQVGQLLEVGGASADLLALTNSGSVTVTVLSPGEARGTFHGQFGNTNDVVDGCFDMFPTMTTGVNPAPSP
jgi:hypothetical protein